MSFYFIGPPFLHKLQPFIMHPSMEDHSLSLPLLATAVSASSSAAATASTARDDHENGYLSSSSSGIIFRLLLVIFIGTVSVWANHEASKGFEVTIINNANKDSPAGKRFALFYVSNDDATRIILNTSAFVENILHHPIPESNQTKKKKKMQIHHVILQLSNLTKEVMVDTSKSREFHYVISLSPSILEERNHKSAVLSAIQLAVARIWLWDGKSRAPPWLIDGMVEYIWIQAGFGEGKNSFGGHEKAILHNSGLMLLGTEQICYDLSQICSKSNNMNSSGKEAEAAGDLCRKNKEPRTVAKALSYLEEHKKGYIQGLNQIVSDGLANNQPCEQWADQK